MQNRHNFIYRHIFNNMSDGYACIKIITGEDNRPLDFVILEVNPAFEIITGIKSVDIVGKQILQSFPEILQFPDWLNTILKDSVSGSTIKFFKFIPQIYKLIEFTVFGEQDGSYHILFREMAHYRQEAGVIKNMLDGIVYYQQILGENGIAVDYKILNVNPAFEKIMNIDRSKLVGKMLTEILPKAFDYLKTILNSVSEVMITGQPRTFEYYSDRKNKWFSVTLFCPNKGYGAAAYTDITKFKLLENALLEAQKSAEAANNAKSELLTNISHELRTPLNVILGAAQLFSSYLGNDSLYKKENAGRHIKTMRQNCLRLIRLVNNIVDSNKIDSGLFQLDIRNYDIINVIGKIVDSTEEYAHLKGSRVILSTNTGEKTMAFDLNAMERIMLNLLSNAFKFSRDKGDIMVDIYCEADNIVITVKDQGVGIPEDKKDLIFERFKQAKSFIVRENEGSGLGLAITKTLIEMHDGSISVNSREGEGSEFIIRLPCKIYREETGDNMIGVPSDRLVERINIEFSDIYL